MDLNISKKLDLLSQRLSSIEKNISKIDEKLEYNIMLQRNQLIQVKNQQEIDDSTILYGQPYNDLSPQRAYSIYQSKDKDFMVLDVTKQDFQNPKKIREAKHIPLENLPLKISEITCKLIPILVISENGLRSIKACEFLVTKGFFNVNNISGGYNLWPEEFEIPDHQNLIKMKRA